MLNLRNQDSQNGNNNAKATFTLELSQDILDIQAHFPGQMLIPAYMQLSWIDSALALVAVQRSVSEFGNIKFIKKIEPTGHVDISVDLCGLDSRGKFQITRDKELLTSGAFLTNE